jgi:DNA repair protein RecN (Recombination protein N)
MLAKQMKFAAPRGARRMVHPTRLRDSRSGPDQRTGKTLAMLRELSVQNMALIEDVRVELEPGFCAWTGETGAGKTLLLSALGLLLGERGSAELLRADTPELRVVGRFELAKPGLRKAVEDILQGPLEDDQLMLMRRLAATGRSAAYVNDQPVTLATLRQLGGLLVDIHGQRESQSLLEPDYQLRLLDAYGDLDIQADAYRAQAARVRELRRRLHGLEADRQNRLRELALLRFEKEELDRAELVPGELAELARERERLVHAQSLQQFAAAACGQLYDDDGAFFEALGKLHREAEHWARLDPSIAEAAARLQGLASETRDLAETLRPWTHRAQADPERLEEIESRIQKLRRLETKYGKAIDELIAHRETLDAREAELAGREEDRTQLEKEIDQGWQALRTAGAELSRLRAKVARRFAAETQKHLAELGMPDARLTADLEPIGVGDDPLRSDIPAHGFEQMELQLQANRGEPARPLRKVASGGELSRTMLALKTVLAGHDQVGTLIFDEIDANVGGRLGDVLGAKLAALGKTHQVICVTHLPLDARFGRLQWTIRKERRGKRTVNGISYLPDADRLEELASMLRGAARGETTRQEAAAMLAAARKRW